MDQFKADVIRGLTSTPKYLSSKYFYNAEGDKIFQEIMNCPEYYLTNCELDIFSNQTAVLAAACTAAMKDFDIVELGPGDALKSSWLLKYLNKQHVDFTYYPIDISENVITTLTNELPVAIPGLKVHGLNGEYFEMLEKVKTISNRNKLVLFLGSSIGNIPFAETAAFFSALKKNLNPGDILLTGFDLKKDGDIILRAYNDKEGITRRFNLNLLKRINEELHGNFVIENFEHRPRYNEAEGACRSFLVSTLQQKVDIGEKTISFMAGEEIFMEIAQKYTVSQTNDFAIKAGFKPLYHFYDAKHWFLDTLWQAL